MTTNRLIAQKLTSQKLFLATAESCTGGLIAKTLTDIPGSSAFFTAGFVTYANRAKTKLLGVPTAMIEKHGAVSAQVVQAMAAGARRAAGTDFAVATTGVAGPTGGTRKKPVGLVFIATASRRKVVVKRFVFKGTREQIRMKAADKALRLLAALIP
jgi:PncC family amidohydrolase